MSTFNPTQEVVIRPNQSWLHIDWSGIRQYKDLIMLLVRRDFIARYKQTILGPAWFIINPVLTSITFTLVFSRVLGVTTGGVPPILFYLSGMLAWTYFSTLLTATSGSLLQNANIFGKVYFPRLIVPIALALSSAIAFVIQLATFLFFFANSAHSGQISISFPRLAIALLALPAILLHTALLAVGVGLLLAAITAKYRDLQHITGLIVQLWMYASPVIYPFGRFAHKYPGQAWIAALNPMSAIIENTRALFFGSPAMPIGYLAQSIVLSLVVFVIGVLGYQRAARTFIDIV